MDVSDVVGVALVLLKCLLVVIGMVFLISGLDDLFIDLCYLLRWAYRRVAVLPRHRPMTDDDLRRAREQPIAVMIPAWDESAVIRPMLQNTLRALDYANYTIFVGTYPNDPDTQLEVEKVRELEPRVQRTVCPHDGPTNKADCLNWIYQGIRLYEKKHGVEFAIFVMQDCEDVIHPLSYKVFNYLMPRKDMVQLPVLSLEPRWHQFTAGHYLDEFAQLHHKDMVVRELLDGSIPAAGVGCAFSRRAFEVVARENKNQLFSVDSLTEDYDFGFRLKRYGLRQAFVRVPTLRTVMRTDQRSGASRAVQVRDLICIREYFPSGFRAAARQKSRWVLGITLQGWAHLGWKGSLSTKYMLFRDRKSLVTNLANTLGYVVVFLLFCLWIRLWLDPDWYRYPALIEQGSWLWNLVVANAWLLGLRLFQRAYCVHRLYGTTQALLSAPRMVWGNLINFMATCRAIRLYARYLRTGKLIAWDKTSHTYPSEGELAAFRRRLGEILLEERVITAAQLQEALARQRHAPSRLGEILREMNLLEESDLARALARQ